MLSIPFLQGRPQSYIPYSYGHRAHLRTRIDTLSICGEGTFTLRHGIYGSAYNAKSQAESLVDIPKLDLPVASTEITLLPGNWGVLNGIADIARASYRRSVCICDIADI